MLKIPKAIRACAFATFLLLLAAAAQAQQIAPLSGKELLHKMQQSGGNDQNWFAVGYVNAVIHISNDICPPTGATVAIAYLIVVKHLRKTADIEKLSAQWLVNDGLSKVWPCKNGAGEGPATATKPSA